MAEAKFYTYVHHKADTGEVFYVGKGSGLRSHDTIRRSKFWKRTYKKHGLTVGELVWFDVEQEALDHEVQLIKRFRLAGAVLCNMTDGGEGLSGYKMPADIIKARGEAIKRAFARPDVKAKRSAAISAALLGKKFSEERKAALSVAHKGVPLSDSHKAGLRKRVCTEAHRANLKAANARPDVKARRSEAISAGMKGYVKSEEHRKALSEGLKASWARRKAEKLAQQA